MKLSLAQSYYSLGEGVCGLATPLLAKKKKRIKVNFLEILGRWRDPHLPIFCSQTLPIATLRILG